MRDRARESTVFVWWDGYVHAPEVTISPARRSPCARDTRDARPALMPAGLARAVLLVIALGAARALRPRANFRPLLLLRGGDQDAVMERTVMPTPVEVEDEEDGEELLRKVLQNKPKKKLVKKRASFDMQDGVTAALSLSVVGAAGLASGPLMAAAPPPLKDVVWMLFGSALSSMMFLLMRIFNYARAMSLNSGERREMDPPSLVCPRFVFY